MSTHGNCKYKVDNLAHNSILTVIALLERPVNQRFWEAVSQGVEWLSLYFHLVALSDLGEVCEVLRWLLRGHLRPGSRRSTQWQYHDHRQRYRPKTRNTRWWWVVEAAELSLRLFPQGTCFTSTLATSWATQSASWDGRGSVFHSCWRLTFCLSWEGSRIAPVSSFSGLGWDRRACWWISVSWSV